MSDSINAASKEIIDALGALMKKVEKRPRLVTALTDPQTSNEAFYSMLFGDVETMLDKVVLIEKSLHEAGENLTGRLNLQVSQLTAAAEKATLLINAVAEAGKKQVITQLNDSKSVFAAEMMETTRATAIEAATEATQAAIGAEVQKSLAKIDTAASEGEKRFAAAAKRLDSATKLLKTSTTKVLAGALGVAIITAALTVTGMHFLTPAPVLTLSKDQANNVKYGEVLKEILPDLDVKTQNRIGKLVKEKSQ